MAIRREKKTPVTVEINIYRRLEHYNDFWLVSIWNKGPMM